MYYIYNVINTINGSCLPDVVNALSTFDTKVVHIHDCCTYVDTVTLTQVVIVLRYFCLEKGGKEKNNKNVYKLIYCYLICCEMNSSDWLIECLIS